MDNRAVFFDEHDTMKRILCLCGHVDDSYFVAGTMQNSMEFMLETHLKKMGYELVLFYNGVQRLYCYSPAMACKRDEVLEEKDLGESGKDSDFDQDLIELLGEDAGQADENPQSESPLRLNHVSDEMLPSMLDKVMRNEKVKSAIVFSDGWDLLENTDPVTLRTMSNRFRSWYRLGANNRNIAIICFETLTQTHLTECIHHVPSWSFLRDKLIQGNKFSSAVKYISIPGKDELTGRLLLEKGYRDLSSVEREKVLTGAQCKLHDLGNTLKGFDEYLKHEPDAIQSLMNYDENDEKAVEILRTTKGWEPVVDFLDRVSHIIEMTKSEPVKPHSDPCVVSRMTENPPFRPSGVIVNLVLKGKPGVGKTTIARLLGKAFRHMGLLPSGHVVQVARDDLVGRYIGHTAANTREKINEAEGGILFVDEAYSLFRSDHNTTSGDFGLEAIDTITEAMTRSVGSFAVILAGYPDEMEVMLKANPGLRSRFGMNIITIEDYPPELLEEIAINHLAEQFSEEIAFDESLLKPGITGNKPLDVFFKGWFNARNRREFGNARAARDLVEALGERAHSRGSTTIMQEDFPKDLQCFFKEADLDINSVIASMDDIVGQEALKNKMLSFVKRVRLRNDQLSVRPDANLHKVCPGHYLFSGNPGTGKTTIAEKMAQILGALRVTGRFTAIRYTGSTLINELTNQGISGVRRLIDDARGGVLFIDEAHQLINYPIILQQFLDPMLNMKDELCIIFACYERDVDDLFNAEPGLMSRITSIFNFADYSADEILEIFKIKVKNDGYLIESDALEAAREWFNSHLLNDGESSNGRYAERLLMEIEEQKALNYGSLGESYREDDLFTITISDMPGSTVDDQ